MSERSDTCPICGRRRANAPYCAEHTLAKNEILAAFRSWNNAYGDIRWERYLDAISKLQESGQWIKEVSSYELGLPSSRLKNKAT